MKKVLSLVLAFAMILGSFGFVFAGQYSDVSDTAYYSEPVSVLSGLGVVNGVGDGKFNPEGNVTRAQMAVMIVNCLGITVSSKADTGFTDVPASNPYSGWIKYAANLGIIAGYGDGKFGPDDPVTYDQALTMIIASLGYTSEGLGGTWPGNFINQARALGILSTCKTTGSAPASRADICCFLYDALETPMGKTNKDGEFVPTVVGTSGFGLFTTQEYDNILHRLEAHVLADMSGNPREIVVTPEVMADSAVDLSDYLGALITVLVNKDETEIVAVKEVLSTFVEGTYDEIVDKYTKGVANNSATRIINGDENGTSYFSAYSGFPFTLKLAAAVNGKEIEEVYSIQYWSPSSTFRVTDGIVEEFEDNDTLNSYVFAKDDDKNIVESAYTIFGRDTVADIAADDIVTVYLHTAAAPDDSYKAGDIARIEVGTETVEGKITKIDKNDLAYIGGKAYALAIFSGLDLPTMMSDKDEGTFFLDYAGDLFDFDPAPGAATAKNYALVLSTSGAKANDGTEQAFVELLLADGTAKKFEVDCTKYTDAKPDFGTSPYDWTDPLAPGTIVQYEEKDGVIIDFPDYEEITYYDSTPGVEAYVLDPTALWEDAKVTSTGKFKDYKDSFTSKSIIFKALGTKWNKASNYEVLTMADVVGKTIDVQYLYGDSATPDYWNVMIAVIVEEASAASKDMALFLEYQSDTPDGEEWTIFLGSEMKDVVVSNPPSAGYDITAPQNVTLYELTFTDDVAEITGTETPTFDQIENDDAAVVVSGNGFTDEDGAHYDLAKDLIVYVYTASTKTWSIGNANSMAGKSTTSRPIGLYVTYNDDNEVCMAIVIK